jgi:dienelactone hydrolase
MIVEKKVGYEHDGRKFEGAIVYDDSVKTKRPVLYMQPDWNGVCGHTLEQARAIAGKDYVVLMADMFGEGYGAKQKTVDDLMKSSRGVRGDVAFINACGAKALDVLGAEANKLGLVDLGK